PEEFGGAGLDALTTARVLEALGRGSGDLGLCFSIAAHLFACVMPIVRHGSADAKRRLLPKLCSGEWIGANAITEDGAGSDVFAPAARYLGVSAFAVPRDTPGFRFGQPFEKMGLRSAPIASLYLEDCRVGPEA